MGLFVKEWAGYRKLPGLVQHDAASNSRVPLPALGLKGQEEGQLLEPWKWELCETTAWQGLWSSARRFSQHAVTPQGGSQGSTCPSLPVLYPSFPVTLPPVSCCPLTKWIRSQGVRGPLIESRKASSQHRAGRRVGEDKQKISGTSKVSWRLRVRPTARDNSIREET